MDKNEPQLNERGRSTGHATTASDENPPASRTPPSSSNLFKTRLPLALLAVGLICGSAVGGETAWTRKISCMPPGPNGASTNGTYTIFSKIGRDGSVEVTRSKVRFSSLRFLIEGKPGSTIKHIVASTTKNGDGDDRWFSDFENTNTPRITRISLTLTQEDEEQSESFVVTSKGNVYKMSCSINGPSG